MDDFSGGSFIDLPSFDTQSDFPTFGDDLMSQFNVPAVDTFDPYAGATWVNDYLSPEVTGSVNTTQTFPTIPGSYSQGALGAGSGGDGSLVPAGTGTGANPWLAGILGAAGPFASLMGALASGGVTGSRNYAPTTAQKAILNQAYPAGQQLGQFAAGQTPLQQQQASLLNAIAAGQIPQSITDLVRSAYSPVMQNLWTDATEAGRRAGFYDAPATSPVGSNVLGPGLAQAQGQMAGDILKQMTTLPGLYNQPIQSQGNFASNWMSGALGVPQNQQNTQPIGSQIGTGLGNVIGGAAQGYGLAQTQQQQNSLLQQGQQNQSLLQALLMNQGQTNMSGTS